MKKVIIVIPVFNDWESLIKLLNEINNSIQEIKNYEFSCIVVNDSSNEKQPKISRPINLKSLTILNMKENRGHQRSNAFGLRYICDNRSFNFVILMDGDGEDRPIEIKEFIKKILHNPEISVVAKRVKRSEGKFFQISYKLHKLITLIFTGKNINFGNFSCLTKRDVKILSTQASLWNSLSASVKKNLKKLEEINSIRGIRYFGPSKMSVFNLVMHSFSIISVFKYQVFLRSTFAIIALSFLNSFIGIYSILLQILSVVFNLLIFTISLRDNKKALFESHLNLLDETDITH